MSNFQGIMREYPKISLDRFDGKNLESTAYFLSHCHSDHMQGLKNNDFYRRLVESKKKFKLFTSEGTGDILKNDDDYRHLTPFISVIEEVYTPTIIEIPRENNEKSEVTVTLLPAGHCPGSVMFLFEGNEGTVLYTGDFRWSIGDAERCRYLMTKNIQSLYLDTTFCVPSFLHIPKREISCDALIKFVGKCLKNRNIVRLVLPAQYGYEYLFVKLYERFKVKIHVDSDKISKFLGVNGLTEAITEDSCTQIHACYKKTNSNCVLPCNYSPGDMKVKTIKVSAMWFEGRFPKMPDTLQFDEQAKIHRLFFSTHSSLKEVCDFVSTLKPKNLYPNVVPCGSSDEQVLELLKKYQRNVTSGENSKSSQELVALGILSSECNYLSGSSQSSDQIFDVDLCSPVKSKLSQSQNSDSVEITEVQYRTVQENSTLDSKHQNGIIKKSSKPEIIDLTVDDNSLHSPKPMRRSEIEGDNHKTPERPDDGDSTPDEFTPDPKSSPAFRFENGKHHLIDFQNQKRRKLFL